MNTAGRLLLIAGLSPVVVAIEALAGPPYSLVILGTFLLVATVLLVRRVDDDGAR